MPNQLVQQDSCEIAKQLGEFKMHIKYHKTPLTNLSQLSREQENLLSSAVQKPAGDVADTASMFYMVV